MDDDFFLQTLINSVRKTYYEWYCPDQSFKKELEKTILDIQIENHINILKEYYNKERFAKCKNLYDERVKFLNEVQQIVNTLRGL